MYIFVFALSRAISMCSYFSCIFPCFRTFLVTFPHVCTFHMYFHVFIPFTYISMCSYLSHMCMFFVFFHVCFMFVYIFMCSNFHFFFMGLYPLLTLTIPAVMYISTCSYLSPILFLALFLLMLMSLLKVFDR